LDFAGRREEELEVRRRETNTAEFECFITRVT
jgi:hypothetical protein